MTEQAEKIPAMAYPRIAVADVTPLTAPPYGTITHTERNSLFVLTSPDGNHLLIGTMGVNYFTDGPSETDVIYLRRFDQPPHRLGKKRHQPITIESQLTDS